MLQSRPSSAIMVILVAIASIYAIIGRSAEPSRTDKNPLSSLFSFTSPPAPEKASRSFVVDSLDKVESNLRTNEHVLEVRSGLTSDNKRAITVYVEERFPSNRPRKQGLEVIELTGTPTKEEREAQCESERRADRLAGRNIDYAKRHAFLQEGRRTIKIGQSLEDVIRILGKPDVVLFRKVIDENHAVVGPGELSDLISSKSEGYLVYTPFEQYDGRRHYKGIRHYYNVVLLIGENLSVRDIGDSVY